MLSSWQHHCKSSLGSHAEYRAARWLPTLRPSQLTECKSDCGLLASKLLGTICYHTVNKQILYCPIEGRRLSYSSHCSKSVPAMMKTVSDLSDDRYNEHSRPWWNSVFQSYTRPFHFSCPLLVGDVCQRGRQRQDRCGDSIRR